MLLYIIAVEDISEDKINDNNSTTTSNDYYFEEMDERLKTNFKNSITSEKEIEIDSKKHELSLELPSSLSIIKPEDTVQPEESVDRGDNQMETFRSHELQENDDKDEDDKEAFNDDNEEDFEKIKMNNNDFDEDDNINEIEEIDSEDDDQDQNDNENEESNENKDENGNIIVKKKRYNKRRSGLFRALGIHQSDYDDEDKNLNEVVIDRIAVSRSPRAAATIAKTKLIVKPLRGYNNINIMRTNNTTNTSTSQDDDAKSVGNHTPGPKKRLKLKSTDDLTIEDTKEEPVVAPWACCDTCQKWRKLPLHVQKDTLSDQWFCVMNIWDNQHNFCEAEEEIEEDLMSQDPSQNQNQSNDGTEVIKRGRGNWRSNKKVLKPIPNNNSANDSDNDDEKYLPAVIEKEKRPYHFNRKPRNTLPNINSYNYKDKESNSLTNWAQCNRCTKWRKVPLNEELPEIWNCSMNIWNPFYSKCSVKQENDETIEITRDVSSNKLVSTETNVLPGNFYYRIDLFTILTVRYDRYQENYSLGSM